MSDSRNLQFSNAETDIQIAARYDTCRKGFSLHSIRPPAAAAASGSQIAVINHIWHHPPAAQRETEDTIRYCAQSGYSLRFFS